MQRWQDFETYLFAGHFTATHNPLEDMLLAQMPGDYYRVWRYVWRSTVGYRQLGAFMGMRQIKDDTMVQPTQASRVLNFLHMVRLIDYKPGQKDKTNSHVTVLPDGWPDAATLDRIGDYIGQLRQVESIEARVRRIHKTRRLTNAELCGHVRAAVEAVGGDVYCAALDAVSLGLRMPPQVQQQVTAQLARG